MKQLFSLVIFSAISLIGCGGNGDGQSSSSESVVIAPTSLAGMRANLTLEWSQSSLPPGSYPPTGEVAHIYNTSENFSVDGSQVNMPAAMGTYNLTKPSLNKLKDSGFNQTFNVPYEIIYTFDTLTSGTFTENFGSGTILWTGRFNIKPIN